MNLMYDHARALIDASQNIIILQAENPDGDSLGSSLALEEILEDLHKKVTLYCRIDIPKYLRYIRGWDRVVSEFDHNSDLVIIVDAASEALFTKTLTEPGIR